MQHAIPRTFFRVFPELNGMYTCWHNNSNEGIEFTHQMADGVPERVTRCATLGEVKFSWPVSGAYKYTTMRQNE